MPISLKPPPLGSALRGSLTYARRAREQVRAGLSDARIATLRPPLADQHFHRFVYGFSMPLTMMRVGWSNPQVRRSMIHRLIPPLLLVALVAIVGAGSIAHSVVTARHDPTALAKEVDHDDGDDDDDDKTAKGRPKVDKDAVAKAALAAKARGGSMEEVATAAIEAAKVDDVVKAAAPEPAPRRTGFAAAAHAVFAFLTSKVAKLIATLSILEWILVWIGREHHDQIAYEMAALTGVPGEALPDHPRLRLDLAWLKMKGWRALRLLIFLGLIAPVVWVVGHVPVVGSYVGVAVEAAWAVYWAGVFAVANTFLVWEDPVPPGVPPWFIRVLERGARLPLLGRVLAFYARVLRFATKRVWPACMAFEETAWESLGLATARAIASVPVLYIITRPAFTPAATDALLARVVPREKVSAVPEGERVPPRVPPLSPIRDSESRPVDSESMRVHSESPSADTKSPRVDSEATGVRSESPGLDSVSPVEEEAEFTPIHARVKLG